MTFLGLEARAALPKVAYPTALDYFIFLTFGFIFATILQVIRGQEANRRDSPFCVKLVPQFAFVHYFTKIGYGEVYFVMDADDHDDGHTTDEDPPPPLPAIASPGAARKVLTPTKQANPQLLIRLFGQTRQVHPQQQVFSVEHHLMSLSEKEATVVQIHASGHSPHHHKRPESNTTNREKSPRWDGRSMNSVSRIDQVSRAVFPILFVAINLFYWYTYIPPS